MKKNCILSSLSLSIIINPITNITSFTIVSSSFRYNSFPSSSFSSSALNLVPSQGCQLAAASAAALAKIQHKEQEEDQEQDATNTSTSIGTSSTTITGNIDKRNIRPSDATREFISRLFYRKSLNNNNINQEQQQRLFVSNLVLPSDIHEEITKHRNNKNMNSMIDNQKANHNNNNNGHTHKYNHDDIVYFPIVGFQYIKLKDGSIRGVPTMNALPQNAVCNFSALNKSRMEPLYGYYSPCCYLKD